jgi:hypothetical protein
MTNNFSAGCGVERHRRRKFKGGPKPHCTVSRRTPLRSRLTERPRLTQTRSNSAPQIFQDSPNFGPKNTHIYIYMRIWNSLAPTLYCKSCIYLGTPAPHKCGTQCPPISEPREPGPSCPSLGGASLRSPGLGRRVREQLRQPTPCRG